MNNDGFLRVLDIVDMVLHSDVVLTSTASSSANSAKNSRVGVGGTSARKQLRKILFGFQETSSLDRPNYKTTAETVWQSSLCKKYMPTLVSLLYFAVCGQVLGIAPCQSISALHLGK